MKIVNKKMKKLNHIYINVFIFIILSGCSDLPLSSDILTIDITPHIDNPITLKASDIVSEMRYIALETTDSSLLDDIEYCKIIQQDEYIFIQYAHQYNHWLYMFDNNGKYIRQIGKQGQGPNEYIHLYNFDIDNDTVYLYDGARRRILFYDYNNQYLKNISVQSNNITDIMRIWKMPEGFLCYQNPLLFYNKKEPVPDLILLDENGKEKKILHYRTLNINALLPFSYSAWVKKYKDKVFIYFPLQDTIFSVHEGNLKAEIIINRGEHAVYPENMDSKEERSIVNAKGLFINKFTLNDKWLFLYCTYRNDYNVLFMYNFDTKELKRVSEIINDVDNTFDIFPIELSDDKMFDGESASEIIERNKIPPSIKNLEEDDNPVIRISNFK
jgi:hypothetical protein